MSSIKTADVIIVGSGIVGNSCAYYCAKKGLTVIVLEEENIIGNGGSSRNGGGVRVSGRKSPEIPLAKYAIDNIWPHLADELGVDIEYEKGGNLRLASDETEIKSLQEFVEVNRGYGLKLSMLDKQETEKWCPYVNDKIVASSICFDDGHANPLVTTLAFYKRSRELGVRYYTGDKVIQLKKYKDHIHTAVTAGGNVYEADNIIIAAGFKTRTLLNTVNADIPLIPRLIEIFVTEAVPPMFSYMLGTIGANGGFYGHQTKHGSFVFGGTSGFESAPQYNLDTAPTLDISAPSIARGVLTYFPELAKLKIIRTWAGWTDLTTEWIPCIGPVDEAPGLLIAAGFSGHGFCLGPVVGKIISETIVGEKLCVNYRQLRYNRFQAAQ